MKEALKGLGTFAVIIVCISFGALVVISTIHITFAIWGPLP